ncbi:class I SAM-dependent methyltransferase [Arcobacter cloacae]|uniref:Methyltransferase n=1 Tax=Arcobacter cloacae TaxID=1054034 RepID=A0A4Q0ZG69_9BACT|nr:class I SAM-dependent methyltransferase [Arcobacter cloacae]RXJ83911.1 methyltransferase [Arcobacter cloacae]
MKRFSYESMFEIISYLEEELKTKNEILFEVLNPNIEKERYIGEKYILENQEYIYRNFKTWTDLAELFLCRLNVESINKNKLIIKFDKLNKLDSFHNDMNNDKNEKYGENSTFFRINKNEDASFLFSYINALKNVKIEEKKEILNLGINKADEFEVIKNLVNEECFNTVNFTGIDYSASAIEYAKNRFPQKNFQFFVHDINNLKELKLKKADLIISIGTLQSSGLNFKLLFMELIQNHLEDKGSIILGFPNCRWINGEVIYGAKAPNYSYSEQSILYKDVYFCKKYLQQKKYRVTLTGKNYLFLTATSIK